MITRVRVKNFRSIADIDVTLGPLTVLVGRNGAGKSTFLDVLRFVRDILRGTLDDAIVRRGGINSLIRWHEHDEAPNIEITLTATDGAAFWGEYSFTLSGKPSGEYLIKAERCRIGTKEDQSKPFFETKDGHWIVAPPNPFGKDLDFNDRMDKASLETDKLAFSQFSPVITELTRLSALLLGTNFSSIYPNRLRSPQKHMHYFPLSENGENLASVLRHMQETNEWYPDLASSLHHIVDDVCNIRVREVGGYLVTELEHKWREGRSHWSELGQESDGTLRALAILTELYHEDMRLLSVIEEPEIMLYPGILPVLVDVIKETSLRKQILLTTQSPDFMSQFPAEQLRIVERIEGATQIGPIDEKQLDAVNRQLFSSGELLLIEGLHRAETAGAGNA